MYIITISTPVFTVTANFLATYAKQCIQKSASAYIQCSPIFRTKSEERTWEAGSEVLHQSLLVDRLVGRVHSRDGQAQDLPQRDEL